MLGQGLPRCEDPVDQRGLWSARERLGMQQDEGCVAGALRLWLLGAEERPCVQLRAQQGVTVHRCVSVRPRPCACRQGKRSGGGWQRRMRNGTGVEVISL